MTNESWGEMKRRLTEEGLMTDKFKSIAQIILTVQEQLAIDMRVLVESIGKSINVFPDLSKMLQDMGKNYERYCLTLLEIGWVPTLEIDMKQVSIILEQKDNLDEESFKEYIEEFFLAFYNEEVIVEMFNEWSNSSKISKRIPIIKTAIDCHIEGKYYASIPTLMPQLEGMIVDANMAVTDEWVSQNKVKEYFLQTSAGDGAISELVEGIVLNVLYQNFRHGEKIVGDLNRNAILHGGDVEYGAKTKSLKLILLFDYFFGKVLE